jgi:hypothetical protein
VLDGTWQYNMIAYVIRIRFGSSHNSQLVHIEDLVVGHSFASMLFEPRNLVAEKEAMKAAEVKKKEPPCKAGQQKNKNERTHGFACKP